MNVTQEQPTDQPEQPTQSKQAGNGTWKDAFLAGLIIIALAIILTIANGR